MTKKHSFTISKVLAILLGLFVLTTVVPPETVLAVTPLSASQSEYTITAKPAYTGLKLSWKGHPQASRYLVYLRQAGGSYKRIANTSKTSFYQSTLTPGKTYYIRVRGYRQIHGKNYFTPYYTTCKVVMGSYSPYLATFVNDNEVTLKWSNTADWYSVYVKPQNGSYRRVANTKSLTRTLTLDPGTYSVCVKGYLKLNGKNIPGAFSKIYTIKINPDQITFTSMVAISNPECSVKITGIEENDISGFTLKTQLENKSASKTYMFAIDSASINGIECSAYLAEEVTAGKKANDEIYFSDDILKENGIGKYTDIELTLRVYDSDNWEAPDVARKTIHIYPYGENKARKFIREPMPNDNVIADNPYVSVIVTGYSYDDIWGYTVNLFLLNKTDKNIMFAIDDVSVNGFMIDPFYANSVRAGKCEFSDMDWSERQLKENGITKIENIEFTLRAYDDDDWMVNDFFNDTVILNP